MSPGINIRHYTETLGALQGFRGSRNGAGAPQGAGAKVTPTPSVLASQRQA